MKKQQKISKQNMKKRIGKEYEVLIENISFDGSYLIGRTKQDVPEIDGVVYIKNENQDKKLNQFVNVIIGNVEDYDLIGKIN